MRRASLLVLLSFTAAALGGFSACVGDEPVTTPPPGDDGGSGNDGGPGNDGGATGDGSTTTDGGGEAAVDAGPPPCGYPGETCCELPALPCNQGGTCAIAAKKCMVGDAWAVGEYMTLNLGRQVITAHYNGSTWERGPDVPGTNRPKTIIQAGGTVRVITNHNDASGDDGLVYYLFNNAEFRLCPAGGVCPNPPTIGGTGELVGLEGVTYVDNEFWYAGVNQFYRCAAGNATCTSTITGMTGTWSQGNFAGWTNKDLWYSNYNRAFRYDGATWTTFDMVEANAIYQVRKDDLWGGTTKLQHYRGGAAWDAPVLIDGAAAPALIAGLGGAASDDLWAVGSEPSFAAHYDGTQWKKATLPAATKDIEEVWAPSRIEAWVGGSDGTGGASGLTGTITKWNGTSWAVVPSPTVTLGGGDVLFSPVRWIAISGTARPRP